MTDAPVFSDPILIVLSGLPGVGKTTLARHLARRCGAVHLRIDTIEAGLANSARAIWPAEDAGYVAAWGVARDNLRLGLSVVGDSVNPDLATRSGWHDVASGAGVQVRDVEVVCSDPALHRRRVEERMPDLAGLTLPTWDKVQARAYVPWPDPVLSVDTAMATPEACVDAIVAALAPA